MIARRTWRESWLMTLVYFLLLEVLLVGAILFWPTLAEELERKKGALESLMPAEFLKRMVRSWSTYAAYIATQQFFKGANIVGIACAVLLGTGAIARERENGTLELLLSRPISRARILWAKAWVLALCVVVPIYLSSLTIIPLSKYIPGVAVDVSFRNLMMASTHASIFCVMFLAGTLLCSAFFHSQVHVAFTIGGLILLEVGIYFIQEIRVGSIFMLSDHDVYWPMMAGNVHWDRWFLGQGVWLLLATVALYVVTHLRFRRMDL